MNEWDVNTFDDHLGKKVSWGILTGRSYSGKKTIAATLASLIKGKIIKVLVNDATPVEYDQPLFLVDPS